MIFDTESKARALETLCELLDNYNGIISLNAIEHASSKPDNTGANIRSNATLKKNTNGYISTLFEA